MYFGKSRKIKINGLVERVFKYDKVVFFSLKQQKGGYLSCVSYDQSIIRSLEEGDAVALVDFSLQNQKKIDKNGVQSWELRVICNLVEKLDLSQEQISDYNPNEKTHISNFLDELLKQEDKNNEEADKKQAEELADLVKFDD